MQELIAQGNLVLNTGSNGTDQADPILGNINISGTLTLNGTLNANTISVIGDVMLNGTIRTTGNQTWTGPNSIILTGNSSLIAGQNSNGVDVPGGDLDIGRKIYSYIETTAVNGVVTVIPTGTRRGIYVGTKEGSAQHDLSLQASNDVTIANDIGLAPGVNRTINSNLDAHGLIYDLNVVAGRDINIYADISTQFEQQYQAGLGRSINIGSIPATSIHNQVNWNLSGATGYSAFDPAYVKENNASLVRTLISVDPKIQFNSPVNDQVEGTHSLVTIAIARDRAQNAEVIFSSTVGAQRKLYSVSARTLEYLEGEQAPSVRGTVSLGGSVNTVANQTYESKIFEILGNAGIALSSDSGKIRVLAASYQMTVGMSLSYSFSNPPEISTGPGLIRLADVLRDVPSTDVSAGVLSGKLMRMAVFSDESNNSAVEAQVSVGEIEDGKSANCAPNSTADECQVTWQ
ncbi:hypothetical protein [Polynucleobacter cosmopolitanus]|uniref:Uncharacterized protein n=1 Tax=Polynucleobacter cosmopolitanus TaxID=351345 RepID=A0A229FRQ0_9BURK|nr:hypothetical protein [Polynucleobacter cosmopolitanus]OXL14634.1 hypothetical protein AOC33_09040 [Polynucleobacter cosmopolitanus]